jgi:hypothetical protein
MFPLSITTIVAVLVAFILGYVARKYVEKKWPAEAQRLDDKAQYYGEDLRNRAGEAVDQARQTIDQARDKFGK